MTRDDWKSVVVTLFKNYDSSRDTQDGSAFSSVFLDPLLDRIYVSDDDDTETFVADRLHQKYPDLALVEPGSSLGDILVKGPSVVLEALRRSVQQYRRERAGLSDPSALTPDSAGDLAGNFFQTRSLASYVSVTVRMFFSKVTHTFLYLENTARTASGLVFIPAYVIEVTEDVLQANRQGGQYYLDALFMAERPGSGYAIAAGDIFTVDGVPNLVSATNLSDSSLANDDEQPYDLAQRVIDGITDRSLVVARGSKTVIRELLPDVAEVLPVGFGDEGMDRDLLQAIPVVSGASRPSELLAIGYPSTVLPLNSGVADGFPYSNVVSGLTHAAAVGDVYSCKGRDRCVSDPVGTTAARVDDFCVKVVGLVHVSSRTVVGGAAIIDTADASVQPEAVGSVARVAVADRCFWWTADYLTDAPGLRGSQVVSEVRVDDAPGVGVDAGLLVFYKGGSTSATEAVVVEVPGDSDFVYVQVPGALRWPTGGSDDVFLTVEETSGDTGLWVEFVGDQHVVEFVPAWSDGNTGPADLTWIKVPIQAQRGWADGDGPGVARKDVSSPDIVLEADPDRKYKWTVWSADTSSMFTVDARGDARQYKVAILTMGSRVPQANWDDPDTGLLCHTDSLPWSLRRPTDDIDFTLAVSGVPGGLLYPGDAVIPNDSVHIGGKTDVYTFPRTPYAVAPGTTVTELRDVDALVEGEWLTWGPCSDIVLSPTEMLSSEIARVNPRCAAVMRWSDQSGDGGAYLPTRVVDAQLPGDDLAGLVVGERQPTGEANGVRFYVTSPYTTYDLKTPRVFRVRGNDLRVSVGSSSVFTGKSLAGVVVGDTLRVTTECVSKGVYAVVSIGDYGVLVLDRPLQETSVGLAFEVFSLDNRFSFPMLRVESLTMDDGGGTAVVPNGRHLGVAALTDFQRGVGTIRVYFQDPTFFRVPKEVPFLLANALGQPTEVSYLCADRTVLYRNSVVGSDAEVIREDTGTAIIGHLVVSGQLHLARAFLRGSRLHVNRKPVAGSEVLEGADLYVSGLGLRLKVGPAAARTLTFSGQNPIALTATAAPGGVIEQINRFFPGVTATVTTGGTLQLACDQTLEIGAGSANAILGLVNGVSNAAANLGLDYEVADVQPLGVDTDENYNRSVITLAGDDARDLLAESGPVGLQFDLSAEGACVFPAGMQEDVATGLFYQDFHLSANLETPPEIGGVYDVARGATFVLGDPVATDDGRAPDAVVHYGYHLATENPALAFSMAEELRLKVSAVFFGPKASDITQSVYLPAGKRLSIRYTYCPVTFYVDALLSDVSRRVSCADMLAKAALPSWVLGTVWYRRGEVPSVVLPDLQGLIRSSAFGGYLDISQVRAVFERYGAMDFTDPVGLFVLVENQRREFALVPFLDRFQVGSLSHLSPDPDRLSATRL